jgi:hypothetical protein
MINHKVVAMADWDPSNIICGGGSSSKSSKGFHN